MLLVMHTPRRSVKALYRSAMAISKMGLPSRMGEAIEMLQRAELLDPKSSEVVCELTKSVSEFSAILCKALSASITHVNRPDIAHCCERA